MGDIHFFPEGETKESCQKKCSQNPRCQSVTFKESDGMCWLGSCQIGIGCYNKHGENSDSFLYSECNLPPEPDNAEVYSLWAEKKATCDGTEISSATQASASFVFGMLAWLSWSTTD